MSDTGLVTSGDILQVVPLRWLERVIKAFMNHWIILPNALFFIIDTGESKTLSQEYIEVLNHQPEDTEEYIIDLLTMKWGPDEGIFLRISSKKMVLGDYSALLNWQIVSGP